MKTLLKIIITKEYQLQIKTINSNNQEIPIKLIDDKEEIDPCISFNGNFIEIGKENEKTMD